MVMVALRMGLIAINESLIHSIEDTPPELKKYADVFEERLRCLPVKYKMKYEVRSHFWNHVDWVD